jgi:SanA protein
MWRRLAIAFCVALVLSAGSLLVARLVIERAAKGKTYSDVSLIPHRHVGLVPGCPRKLPGGWLNPFFENRMAAAAELYFSGKVDYLVVSGDNHVLSYDEPVDMKNALVERGVPANRIYLDYAGFRTLDSVVRVKEIFAQENITIVSQNFQNQRAIFLARHHGIDAIGFNAADVAPQYAAKTLLREQFARVKAILDVYVFHKQPHFLGLKIAIDN